MSTATAIAPNSSYPPNEVDPMLAALRTHIANLSAADEFTLDSIAIVAPDETDEGIDGEIATAVAKSRGTCLLLIAGDAKNPNKEAPGPRMTLDLECQLFVDTRRRAKNATTPLALVTKLARAIHHQEIRAGGVPWWERMYVVGWASFPDKEYTAYAISVEREMQL